MEYNRAQLDAISHKDGPMMVLAGPGSGKTMVITGRARTLIEEYGIPAEQVLVITFTKAAATEMKERFYRMMENENGVTRDWGVRFSTFHSLFFLILRAAYGYLPEQIIREEQQYAFLRSQLDGLHLEIGDEKDFIKDLLSEISLVKSEEIDLAHYYSLNCPEDSFKHLFQAYEGMLKSENLIDFDDMMLLCKELFLARPDILASWQNRCRYILIDEFQDINQLQYQLVRLLAAPQNNLFIVGDDDQSIYRFRGAKPEIMLRFPEDYPETKQITLDQNYRSTKNILKAADRIIRNNQKRFPKIIQAASGEAGPAPVFSEYPDHKEENAAVIRQIQNYQKQGIPLSDMAILYRTNLVARSMAETLTEYNIPFTMKENIPNLYEHWISKNVLAYLRLARMIRQTGNPSQASAGSQNSFETAHTTDNARSGHSNFTVSELSEIRPLFLSVMNRPNRYLTRESLPETQDLLKAEAAVGRAASNPVLRYLALWKRAFSDKDWMIDRLEKLEYDLMQLSSLSPFAAIHYIRNVIGYDEFLKSYSEFRRISLEDLLAQLTEFQESAKPFNRLAEWEQHMKDYGEQLQRQKQTARNKNIDALALSTMHASKGLEYQVVFLPDAVEGITPYKKALKEEDMEEERRLFYVAVTRSKRFLHLCTVKTMFNKPQTPSRFLGEMRLPIEELTAGRKVIHKNYGSGTIKLVKDGRITIWFDKLGKERLLDLNFCICNQLLTLES